VQRNACITQPNEHVNDPETMKNAEPAIALSDDLVVRLHDGNGRTSPTPTTLLQEQPQHRDGQEEHQQGTDHDAEQQCTRRDPEHSIPADSTLPRFPLLSFDNARETNMNESCVTNNISPSPPRPPSNDRPVLVSKQLRTLIPGQPRPGAYEVILRCVQNGIPTRRQDDVDHHGDDILNAESERMRSDFFVPELVMVRRDRFLLVEGVRTDDFRKRYRTLWTLFFFLIFVLIAVAAGLITRRFSSSTPTRSPNPSNTTMGSSTPLGPGTIPVPSTPTDPNKSYFAGTVRLDETIADSLTITRAETFTIVDTFAGQLFLETVNRTDTNFTFFSIGRTASIFEGVDPSYVGLYIMESWIGHAVSMAVVVTNQLDIVHVLSNLCITNNIMCVTYSTMSGS
jgi:hypothetical protein